MKRREGIVSVLCICGLCVDPVALTRDKHRCEVVAILAADRESSRIVFTHINPHCLSKSVARVGKVGKKREVDDGEDTAILDPTVCGRV